MAARPRVWCTYLDRAYLPQASALYGSLTRHAAPFRLRVLSWDERVAEHFGGRSGVEIVAVEDFLAAHPELSSLPGPARSLGERMWTVGAAWVAENAAAQPTTYVDADVLLWSSPEPLFAEAAGRDSVIPHAIPLKARGLPGVCFETHRAFGLYNVGIVHAETQPTAQSWANACREWCYDRLAQDADGRWLYGDQAYLEGFGAYVIQHPGACVGPWCVHNRALWRDGERLMFGDKPLVAYHYSSFRLVPEGGVQYTRPEYQITKRQEELLYRPYMEALR